MEERRGEEAMTKEGFRPVSPLVSDSDRQDTRAQGSCMAHAAKASAWLIQCYWLQSRRSMKIPCTQNRSNHPHGKAPTSGLRHRPLMSAQPPGPFSPCLLRHAAFVHERQKRDPQCIAFMEPTVIAGREIMETFLLLATDYHWLYLTT